MSNSNRQVAHMWAACNRNTSYKRRARSANGNFSYEGAALYSYSTEIARFVRAPSGALFVVCDTHSYSMTTTTKHYSARNNAIPSDIRQIRVDRYDSMRVQSGTHLLAKLYGEATQLEDRARRARQRSGNRSWLMEQARKTYDDAMWIVQQFSLDDDTAQRAIAGIDGMMRFTAIADFFVDYWAAAGKVYEAPLRALADIWVGLRWLDGCTEGYRVHALPTLLRLAHGASVVETTRGAEFPLDHGLAALPLIDRAIERANELQRSTIVLGSHGPRLGHFRVDSVEADGTVRAGCHEVPYFAIRWAAYRAGHTAPLREFQHVEEVMRRTITGAAGEFRMANYTVEDIKGDLFKGE